MMRYRSKPQEVEAVQWTAYNFADLSNFFGFGRVLSKHMRMTSEGIELLAGKDGSQGWVPVPVGHWIVRQPGDFNHHWPVDPTYFAAKYEPVYSRGGTR